MLRLSLLLIAIPTIALNDCTQNFNDRREASLASKPAIFDKSVLDSSNFIPQPSFDTPVSFPATESGCANDQAAEDSDSVTYEKATDCEESGAYEGETFL